MGVFMQVARIFHDPSYYITGNNDESSCNVKA